MGVADGLLGAGDQGGVRVVGGVVNGDFAAVGELQPVHHAGGGGDQIQIVLPLQPLLDDLHVQKPQKAAPEAKTQGHRGLRLEGEGGVV